MNLHITIRGALPDDLPELQRVYRQASLSNADDRAALLSRPEFLVFDGSAVVDGRTRIAVFDGRLVGFVSVTDAGSGSWELEDLFVDPQWQRRGIARQLIADLVRTAGTSGIDTLLVTGNPHARAFYLSVGFVEIGEVATALGVGSRYRLNLASAPAPPPP
jgi:GNAT superfamily N-acetyltransferase